MQRRLFGEGGAYVTLGLGNILFIVGFFLSAG